MTDFEQILPLWRELETAGADYVLATIVAVEGSSYRRPGACMLVAQDGRRAGTVSGGCLEAEVAKKAWWLSENGPLVERYSTLEDDGDLPYGSGCGGVVSILLERRTTASPLLHAFESAFHARAPLAVATVLDGPRIGTRAFAPASEAEDVRGPLQSELASLAYAALNARASGEVSLAVEAISSRVWVNYRAARPGLWIFGAGDDARPLVAMARQLGWFVAVADGRAHLATRNRFPLADEVHAIRISELPDTAPDFALRPGDAAVLMTHSFEQDTRALAWLFSGGTVSPAYVGVLGPQRRTREALARALQLNGAAPTAENVETWLEQLHAPMGLDLGGDTSASVALSILSEIQKIITTTSANPLRDVRATAPAALSR